MDHDAIANLDDVQQLRALLLEQMHVNARQQQSITFKDTTIAKLKAENARLRRLQFAARSEKLSADQRDLFEETVAEEMAAVEAALAKLGTEADTQRVPNRIKKSSPRRQRNAWMLFVSHQHTRNRTDAAQAALCWKWLAVPDASLCLLRGRVSTSLAWTFRVPCLSLPHARHVRSNWP